MCPFHKRLSDFPSSDAAVPTKTGSYYVEDKSGGGGVCVAGEGAPEEQDGWEEVLEVTGEVCAFAAEETGDDGVGWGFGFVVGRGWESGEGGVGTEDSVDFHGLGGF